MTTKNQVADLIRKAFDELAGLHGELTPFDRFYDEDLLECKYQQREMICTDITMLRSTNNDSDKLKIFEELLESIESDIEMLTITRMVEYSKWKVNYMSVCNKIIDVQNKIKSLMQLERNMHCNK